MNFTVDDDLVVRIYTNDWNEYPAIIQASWPEGQPWADREEAEAWAKQWLLSLTDPTADLPGFNPENPVRPRETLVSPTEGTSEIVEEPTE